MKILQNIVKLACLEVEYPKIGFFRILVCNLQTRPVMSNFFWYCASFVYLTAQHLAPFYRLFCKIAMKSIWNFQGQFSDLQNLMTSRSCISRKQTAVRFWTLHTGPRSKISGNRQFNIDSQLHFHTLHKWNLPTISEITKKN